MYIKHPYWIKYSIVYIKLILKLETSFKNVNFEKDDLLSSPNAPTEEPSIGESLLDAICIEHSSKPGNCMKIGYVII